MSVFALLERLEESRVGLSVHEGKLRTSAAKGAVTPELADLIREHRDDLVRVLERRAQQADDLARSRIAPAPAAADHPLSFAQQRLWFIDQLEEGSTRYHIGSVFRLRGPLDRDAVQTALDAIVSRHQVLRTTYANDGGNARQVVREPSRVPIRWLRVSGLPAERRELEARKLADADLRRRFDLANDLMLRVLVVELGPQEHAVAFTLHHIAADGWSIGVLVREFAALYDAASRGAAHTLAEPALQYVDFAHWQRAALDDGRLERQLERWQRALAGVPPVHGLPLDRPRPPRQAAGGARHRQQLPAELCAALNRLAKAHDATLFMALHAAFALLVGRWADQTDVVIGTPSAGRANKSLEPLIGLFVNTLALRTSIDPAASFADLLRTCRATALAAFTDQDVPFEMLVERLQPERSLGHAPVFQILFALQNNDEATLELPGLVLERMERDSVATKFDLELSVAESADGLSVAWLYADSLFERTTIERMAASFATLLAAVVARPETPVGALPVAPAADAAAIAQWNAPALDVPAVRLHDLFAAQATLTPDAIALEHAGTVLSYAELETLSNRLAHYLVAQGAGPERVIGVALPRTATLLVALLAILKSGAAYAPLDPKYPPSRLAHMLEDSAALLVLTESSVAGALPDAGTPRLLLDDLGVFAECPATAPECATTPDELAYLIFTSGSTGRPKAVEIRHRNVVAMVTWARQQFGAAELARTLASTSLNFDLSVYELFVPLAVGATVVLVDDALALLSDAPSGLTLINTVPSAIKVLLEQGAVPESVRTVNLAVEPLPMATVNALLTETKCTAVYNLYGPSEDTTYSTWAKFDAPLERPPTIGRPLPGTQAHVWSSLGVPVPVGVVGELWLGGAGVARGYRARPELTAERFVADKDGTTLYRTGDRVRWNAAGELEFLGRGDDQVKIRGFRIELGEIEWQITSFENVRGAHVLARGDQDSKRLVAYIVPHTPVCEAEWIESLSAALRATLPDYMVPAAFVVLESFPLTPNGKVDKKALPDPDFSSLADAHVAPATATEIAVAAVWAQLLGLDSVGATANFFALGGHSLLATRVVSALAAELGKPLTVRAVFEHPTVRALAAHLDTLASSVQTPIPRAPDGVALPLSFAQQRLWFIDRYDGASPQYNMPGALRLRGALDIAALQRALDALVVRHAILRTTYHEVDGTAVQRIAPAAPLPIAQVDLRGSGADALTAALRAEASQPFDLTADPMLRVTCLALGVDDHVIAFTLHHVAADGWSIGVLVRELMALYSGATLGALPIQYADYAHWQRTVQAIELERQLDWWQRELAGVPALHSLPLDKPRPAEQRFSGASVAQLLDRTTLAALEALAAERDVTLFMLLQAAFAVLLARWSGSDDVVVGAPIAGRTRPELDGLIGCFVNTLVLRTDASGEQPFGALLERAKQTALDAYAHQDVPFEMLVDHVKPVRSLSHTPLVQVLFALQNTERPALELPGIAVEGMSQAPTVAKLDLELTAHAGADGLHLAWLYADSLFERTTIERIAASFATLVASIVATPDALVRELALTPAADLAQLDTWHGAQLAYPSAQCLHELFAARAVATLDAVAVDFGGATLTYGQLDEQTNRLAHALIERGAAPGELVGICVERSLAMVVGIVAVLKTGAAYVPIDPSYPAERVAHILADSGTQLVLTQTSVLLELSLGAECVLLDDDVAYRGRPATAPVLAKAPTAADLAYVIYTSGSTGTPKGVMVEHGAIVAKYYAWETLYALGTETRVHLAMASLGFDVCVGDVVRALGSGGTLVLCPKATLLEPAALHALIERTGVELAEFVPAVFRHLVEHLDEAGLKLTTMRRIVVGSDLWTAADQRRAERVIRADAVLINSYGLTEVSVDSTCYVPDRSAPLPSTIPIGKPLANTRLYVLDAARRRAPIGVVGELYIGGVGLARGYFGREDLTAERFVADPFVADATARMYRTGDLVRWRGDGQLEFVGRGDDQVKIRGFRIELGEIESKLTSYENVRGAHVLARGEQCSKRLIAYVVPHTPVSGAEWIENLRTALRAVLPDYMVPAAFVVLDAFPLTPNGKVDKKALPDPDFAAQIGDGYAAPRDAVETQLCAIWADVLRLPQVGIHDNFFAIGGDSILSIQVVARANRAGLALSTRQLFEAQTVAELAQRVSTGAVVETPQGPVDGTLELFPIQRRFLGEDPVDRHHYNQAVLLTTPAGFDDRVLEEIVAALIQRHDALRLRFVCGSGVSRDGAVADVWTAVFSPVDAAQVAAAVLREGLPAERAELSARCAHWQASLDLEAGPLLRVVHFQGAGEGRLLFALHHLVVDGVSWRVLLSDVEQAYGQHLAGKPIALARKTASLQQWGAALATHAATLKDERAYWLAQLQQPVAAVPIDHAVDAPAVATTKAVSLRLTAAETEQLVRHCGQAYRTQINELLLAGVYLGWRTWTKGEGLRLFLEGHGREDSVATLDLSETVGWFTTLYPLALHAVGDVADVIKSVKEQYRAIPNNGLGYGLLREVANDIALVEAESAQRIPLVFNYLGQLDNAITGASAFGKAPEGSGPAVSPRRARECALELNGLIANGELGFTLDYSTAQYERATMEALAAALTAGLRAVIAHCTSADAGAYTPSDFPLAHVDMATLDTWQRAYPSVSRLYPATPMQQGMLFHSLLDRSAYVTQTYPILDGPLDAAAFRRAWQKTLARHDILRTAFVGQEAELHQLVVGTVELPWHEADWRNRSSDEQSHAFAAYRAADKMRGFDPAQPPLLRIALFRLGDTRWQLLWTHHHMLLDGWCMPLVYREVMAHYAAELRGAVAELDGVPAFERYLEWVARRDRAAGAAHWRAELDAFDAPTPLSIDRLGGDGDGYREQSVSLSEDETARLQALAKRHQTTVNTLVQLAWAYLLHRYSGERDVLFGATIAGRPAEVAGIEQMIGLFINTIPVAVRFDAGARVDALLADLHRRFQDGQEHGYLALGAIQRQSRIPGGTALFDSLLVFENYPLDAALEAASQHSALTLEQADSAEETNYKLTLGVCLLGILRLKCGYRANEFAQVTIARLLAHLHFVLRRLADGATVLDGMDVRTADERALLGGAAACPSAPAPSECFVDVAVAAHARITGAAVAVVDALGTTTYAELDAHAERIAGALDACGVARGDRVGILLERSADWLAAALAIWKSGAAYVPLDPSHPDARLAAIAAGSGMRCVVTTAAQRARVALASVALDALDDEPLRVRAAARDAGDLAYVIYTSGSTGEPKGVAVEHRALAHLTASLSPDGIANGIARGRWGWVAAPAFDASLQAIVQLAHGHTVVVVPDAAKREPALLRAWLRDAELDVMDGTPALVDLWLGDDAVAARLPDLVVGGEAISADLWQRLRAWQRHAGRRAINVYGPTECCVDSTWAPVDGDVPVIGRALPGFRLHVIGAGGAPSPAGAIGELWIGGVGLARGYFGREDLTTERFVADPEVAGERAYRTGDLVRMRADGQLEFVGRGDDQVKIRGFRIELGEIESQIAACQNVRGAHVLARGDQGSKRLIAYVVPQLPVAPDELIETLRTALRAVLPEYMVPAAFVVLDAFPLTPNGKVDKKALPDPDFATQIGDGYVAPRDAVETQLCAIWADVLRLPQVGIHDNFFAIGGDSILSIQVVARANRAGLSLSTRQLFEAQTIAELAQRASTGAVVETPQGPVEGTLELLPIQRRFLREDPVDRHHYNQAVLLTTPAGFDDRVLDTIVAALIARHDALRLRFVERAGTWTAVHAADVASCVVREPLPVERAELSARCAHWQASLALEAGPLLRVVHFHGEREGRLLFALHHLVVDGVSWRVLLSDIEQAYGQQLVGKPIALARKTASLQQWGAALAAHAASDALRSERGYWLAQLQQPVAAVPVDHEVDAPTVATTKAVSLRLTAAETEQLVRHCGAAYRTQISELLLAGVYLGWRTWTKGEGLRLFLEGHGREDSVAALDLSETVGWFTTLYPLALHAAGDVATVIKSVKEQYRAIPNNGLGYGLLREVASDSALIEAEFAQRIPLVFNYLGQLDSTIDAGDAAFRVATESAGASLSTRRRRQTALGLNGEIANGELGFTLDYSAAQYERATMEALAGALTAGLRAVIAHCTSADAGAYTPSDFPLAHVDQTTLDTWQRVYPNVSRLYPATPMQQGMLFHSLLDRSAYVTQTYPILDGPLDAVAFRRAWQKTLARHDIFRTAFVGQEAELHQLVVDTVELPWHEADWRNRTSDEQSHAFAAYRAADKMRGFDPAQPPLLRIALFRLGDSRWQLLWTHHHMLLDGWCMPLVYREVMLHYQAELDGTTPALAAAPVYETYLRWLDRQDRDAARAYWRDTLAALEAPTPLSIDKLGGDGSGYRERHLRLGDAATAELQALAKRHQTTVNTVVQLAWAYLLHRYSGDADVLFGATIAGRPAEVAGIEQMIGLFINTIPVAVRFGDGATVGALLRDLHARFQQGQEHGWLALSEVQRQSRIAGGTPLFDSLLVFENYPLDAAMEAVTRESALTLENAESAEQTNYRLTVSASLTDVLEIGVGYAAETFRADAIERLVAGLEQVLLQLPGADAIGAVDALAPAEHALIAQWNAPGLDVPAVRLHDLFAAQATLTPDAIALEHAGTVLSYAELETLSSRLAHYLVAQGAGPERVIGVALPRNATLLVALLAILKSGAAYAPLDPKYPASRLAHMLEDSAALLVLTESSVAGALPDAGTPRLLLDDLGVFAECPATAPPCATTPDQLAYLIFTSGSTGRPKAVEIRHRNVVAMVTWARQQYTCAELARTLASTSLNFDLSVYELFVPLAVGATVVLVDDALALLNDAPRDLTLINTVPSAIKVLLEQGAVPDSVRTVNLAGEPLPMATVNALLTETQCTAVYNLYGPSEDTTYSTWAKFDAPLERPPTIGRPLPGTQAHVWSSLGVPVPVGVVGELWLAGAGVARGYRARPELTAERFVAHDGSTLYRTGDRVRWSSAGELEFLGRGDDQVKIRGFRIELGEIEFQLTACENVRGAHVLARGEMNSQRLVAYVVPETPAPNAEWIETLRAALRVVLPDYMVPAAFVVLDALPLTPNGKVDKKALPDPDFAAQIGDGYVAPRDAVETQLCAIWTDVLRLPQVGIHDNFFAIGGDSILSIQVVARANRAGLALSTRQLFEAQTIAELAQRVSTGAVVETPQGPVEGTLELLPIQRRFLREDPVDRHHYNQAVLLTTPAGFDDSVLEGIVAALIARHDALRMRFVESAGTWTAVHATDVASCVVREALPAERAELSARCAHWQASLDLEAGPLLRVVHFHGEREGRLLFALHHLVVDGVSWRVLLSDVEQAYSQHLAGKTIALARKSASLQKWGAALTTYATTLQDERAYWLTQLQQPVATVPVDHTVDAPTVATTKAVSVRLDAQETEQLVRHCGQAYRTQINELLLAGVYLGWRAWTKGEGLRLFLEGHGREDSVAELDLSETVGWFTTLYPLTLHVAGDVASVIKAVKEQYRAIPNAGIGYGVLRELTHDPELAAAEAAHPVPLVFNYLGQFDNTINATSAFGKAPEGEGASLSLRRRREHRFELNGLIANGELGFTLDYSIAQYERSTIEALAAALTAGLRAVIAHCTSAGAGAYTPSDFPLAHVEQTTLDTWQRAYPNVSRLYPATPMQQGMLFHSLLDRSAYVTQTYPILDGPLDAAAFRRAWQKTLARHDIFRTAFVGQEAELHQIAVDSVELPWHEADWRACNADEQADAFAAYRAADKMRGFDPAQPPLLRIALFRLGDTRWQLLWTHHHMLLDGWCMPLVYREVMLHYRADVSGVPATLPDAPAYETYMSWLDRQDRDAARAYWRDTLAALEAPTPLSIDKLGGDGSGYRERHVRLGDAATAELQALAKRHQTTVNTVVQLAWAYLLHRYSGDADVLFGATIAGRPAEVAGIEQMIGLFINTIPVAVRFDDGATVGALLRDLHARFQQGQEHGWLALSEIQRQSRIAGGTPLFDSLLVFENYPIDAAQEAESSAATVRVERTASSEATNYALTLSVSLERELGVLCAYEAAQFTDATIARVLAHLERVLLALPHACDLDAIELLGATELDALHRWNDTAADYPRDVRLHELFEAQARRTPDAIALHANGRTLAYGALDAEANALARRLVDDGVARGRVVGLHLERSFEMVVALLAVLKAGAVCLPIQPGTPAMRVRHMLADADAHCILSTSASRVQAKLFDRPVVTIELGGADGAPRPAVAGDASDVAYVLYTSGSTGEAKGVCLHHRGLVNHVLSKVRGLALGPADTFLQNITYTFDPSIYELFCPLAVGAAVVLPRQHESADMERLRDLIDAHGVRNVTLTPTLLSGLLAVVGAGALKSVTRLLIGGESFPPALKCDVLARFPAVELYNLYGPTECSIESSWCRLDRLPADSTPIGAPHANVRLHVLDARGRRVPVGVAGELYIGGDGVALGYLGRDALTQERFVAYAGVDSGRLYRTGDLVRRREDGLLDFVGRLDGQVKIRGFRVELGEVEAALRAHEEIDDCVVVAAGSGATRHLVAYVVLAQPLEGRVFDAAALTGVMKSMLRQRLPEHMVPATYVVLDAVPLNASGKVDRHALPPPPPLPDHDYEPPATATETQLCAIWQRLLDVERVGVGASFFDLGGNSLLVTRMVADVRATFGVELPIREVFSQRTIRTLAFHIDEQAAIAALRNEIGYEPANEDDNEGLIEI